MKADLEKVEQQRAIVVRRLKETQAHWQRQAKKYCKEISHLHSQLGRPSYRSATRAELAPPKRLKTEEGSSRAIVPVVQVD